jgi:hypothetical protein
MSSLIPALRHIYIYILKYWILNIKIKKWYENYLHNFALTDSFMKLFKGICVLRGKNVHLRHPILWIIKFVFPNQNQDYFFSLLVEIYFNFGSAYFCKVSGSRSQIDKNKMHSNFYSTYSKSHSSKLFNSSAFELGFSWALLWWFNVWA